MCEPQAISMPWLAKFPVPIRIWPATSLLLHSVGQCWVVCAAVHGPAPDPQRSTVFTYHTEQGVPGRSPQDNEESSSDYYVADRSHVQGAPALLRARALRVDISVSGPPHI